MRLYHIKLVRDAVLTTEIFLPIRFLFFITGLAYYGYTYATAGRFTNMSGLLFTTSVLVLLIGLVSEQITNLLFSTRPER